MVYMNLGKVFRGRKPLPSSAAFIRPNAVFRHQISNNGPFLPDSNRYVLYISNACPWANGTNVFRTLFHLENHVQVAVVTPKVHDDIGWSFEGPDATPDPVFGAKHLSEIYQKGANEYSGNITVPVLFDKHTQTIVSNESLEIMKMFNDQFQSFYPSQLDRPNYYPQHLQPSIDMLNEQVYHKINNGVYKVGFATSQQEYETQLNILFTSLDDMEARLSQSRYLLGHELTLVDFRLFMTMIRFDAVYYGHFKCNLKRLVDFPNLSNYVRDIYQLPGVANTIHFQQIQDHYYYSHESLNPNRLTALGGVQDFYFPHNRNKFQAIPNQQLKLAGTTDLEYLQNKTTKGTFQRSKSGFRTIITKIGTEENALPAEKGRYHLYIANNCPWCHRVAIGRSMKQLTDIISMDILYPNRHPDRGWQFKPDVDGYAGDSVGDIQFIRELYEKEGSKEGSVPVLYDKKLGKIVNNESADILRFMDSAFYDLIREKQVITLVPSSLEQDIDAWNAWIYTMINNGAYKAGFAKTQEAYAMAYHNFFNALDKINTTLQTQKYLVSDDAPTEADIRLFPTLFRFDHVYFIRFKLNKKMLIEYQYIQQWLTRMWKWDEIQQASNMIDCKQGYFGRSGNNIVPKGPTKEFAK